MKLIEFYDVLNTLENCNIRKLNLPYEVDSLDGVAQAIGEWNDLVIRFENYYAIVEGYISLKEAQDIYNEYNDKFTSSLKGFVQQSWCYTLPQGYNDDEMTSADEYIYKLGTFLTNMHFMHKQPKDYGYNVFKIDTKEELQYFLETIKRKNVVTKKKNIIKKSSDY